MNSAKLLLDEPIIALNPRIARVLGVDAALFLQQLHFRSRGATHADGWWRVQRCDERAWVCWSSEGKGIDLPLGRAGNIGAEPAFRRVVDLLLLKGLIDARQLEKNKWNRSYFYSINYRSFDANFPDDSYSAPRNKEKSRSNVSGEKYKRIEHRRFDKSTSRYNKTPRSNHDKTLPQLDTKKIEKERELGCDAEPNDPADGLSLRELLSMFISKRVGDDTNRDRRRIAEIFALVERGDVTQGEVETLARDPGIHYPSELLVKVRALRSRNIEEAEHVRMEAVETGVELLRTRSEASWRRRVELVSAYLRSCPAASIGGYSALAATSSIAKPLRTAVQAAIEAREVSYGPIGSMVVQLIEKVALRLPPDTDSYIPKDDFKSEI
jgi:hypothetical protein